MHTETMTRALGSWMKCSLAKNCRQVRKRHPRVRRSPGRCRASHARPPLSLVSSSDWELTEVTLEMTITQDGLRRNVILRLYGSRKRVIHERRNHQAARLMRPVCIAARPRDNSAPALPLIEVVLRVSSSLSWGHLYGASRSATGRGEIREKLHAQPKARSISDLLASLHELAYPYREAGTRSERVFSGEADSSRSYRPIPAAWAGGACQDVYQGRRGHGGQRRSIWKKSCLCV